MADEVVVIGSRRVAGKMIERTWKTTYASVVDWFKKNNPVAGGWFRITVIRNTDCGHTVDVWSKNRVSSYSFDFPIAYEEILSE